MKWNLVASSFTILISVCVVGSAEPGKTAARPKIDLSVPIKSIPPGYVGDSIEAVIQKKYVGERGEFERTSEYEARKAKSLATGRYAVLVEDVQIKYDADTESLTITLRAKEMLSFINGELVDNRVTHVIHVSGKRVSSKKYVGTNAFGAQAVVQEEVYEQFSVAPPPRWSGRDIHLTVKNLTPADARVLKPSVRVLMVCDLAPIEAESALRTSEATFKSPYESMIFERAVYTSWVQFYVFNSTNGKILGSFDENGLQLDIKRLE